MAEKLPGSFDEIWLLGDVFGHSWESTGTEDLTQDVVDKLRILEQRTSLAVMGNWEYWLSHPERDRTNKDQGKYSEQLAQRRALLREGKNRSLAEMLSADLIRSFPGEGEPEFTLFHGCSYACHGNSDYQPHPCECYLFPRDLNIVTRGMFGNPENLKTPHFLFGHTHTPGYFTYSVTSMVNMWQFFTPALKNRPISYGDSSRRYGINPGTAGIEERNMPRTAVLLDTKEKTFTFLADERETR